MYEPIEKFEFDHGVVAELHQDEDAMPPSDWDQFGVLVAFPSLSRGYSFAEQDADRTEIDAVERGGSALLVRYLRMAEGIEAVPFTFQDYGSGGARLFETGLDDENPSGFAYATLEKIVEAYGDDSPESRAEARCLLGSELQEWGQYVSGDVYGIVVKDDTGEVLESVWGYYGLEYAEQEAREMGQLEAEALADRRAKEAAEREYWANRDLATIDKETQ